MISKIDGTLTLEIGGKSRKIKYPITAIEELESYLPSNSIHDLPTRFGITLLITATWIGLKWEDKKLQRKVVTEWVEEYLKTTASGDLYRKIYKVLELSGIYGPDEDGLENTLDNEGKLEG